MSDQPQKPELTDEQYEELLKDPEFVRKLDQDEPSYPGSKFLKPWPWGWSWLVGAALRWLAVIAPWIIYEAARTHQIQAEGSMRRLLDSLGMVKGSTFVETLYLQAIHPRHYQIYAFTFVVCLIALHPNKVVSRIAFWLGLPLASAPGIINLLKSQIMLPSFIEGAMIILPRFAWVWTAYALADWLIKRFWLKEDLYERA